MAQGDLQRGEGNLDQQISQPRNLKEISRLLYNLQNSINISRYPLTCQAISRLSSAMYNHPNFYKFFTEIQYAIDIFCVKEDTPGFNFGFKEYQELPVEYKTELINAVSECVKLLELLKHDSTDDMLAWVKMKTVENYLDPTSLNYAIYQRQEKLLGNAVEG